MQSPKVEVEQPFGLPVAEYMKRSRNSRSRVYQLLRAGELESYFEGTRRLITMASIRAREERLLKEANVDNRLYRSPIKRPPKTDTTGSSLKSIARKRTAKKRKPGRKGRTGRPQPRNVHFSSRTDLWSTPQDLFDKLNAEFGFTLDVCAIPENAKCAKFYSPTDDGLAQPWTGVCWLNPPYGDTIGKWLRKATGAVKQGATVVALVPARTDTRWWHDYVQGATEIRYLKGRLKFGGGKHSAPFPSAVVVMTPRGRG
jgi:phage N-6-adenine-methyltransferase